MIIEWVRIHRNRPWNEEDDDYEYYIYMIYDYEYYIYGEDDEYETMTVQTSFSKTISSGLQWLVAMTFL